MVLWVTSEQLAAVLTDGAESQAGWMLRSGIALAERWSAWFTLGSVAVQSNNVTPS